MSELNSWMAEWVGDRGNWNCVPDDLEKSIPFRYESDVDTYIALAMRNTPSPESEEGETCGTCDFFTVDGRPCRLVGCKKRVYKTDKACEAKPTADVGEEQIKALKALVDTLRSMSKHDMKAYETAKHSYETDFVDLNARLATLRKENEEYKERIADLLLIHEDIPKPTADVGDGTQTIQCPCCSRDWNTTRNNACECGASFVRKPTADVGEEPLAGVVRKYLNWACELEGHPPQCDSRCKEYEVGDCRRIPLVKALSEPTADVGEEDFPCNKCLTVEPSCPTATCGRWSGWQIATLRKENEELKAKLKDKYRGECHAPDCQEKKIGYSKYCPKHYAPTAPKPEQEEEIEYKDRAGNPTTLDALCRNEPGWAASRIRVGLDELAKAEKDRDKYWELYRNADKLSQKYNVKLAEALANCTCKD